MSKGDIINQNIAEHELKLTHSSKLTVGSFLWFPFLGTWAWSFGLNLKQKMFTLNSDFQKLLWKPPPDILQQFLELWKMNLGSLPVKC